MSYPDSVAPRPRVLLVEDDDSYRATLSRWLAQEYDVVTACDGVEGLERAAESPPPNVVVTDVAMPRLDGLEMVRRMKQVEALRRVPVIFLSAQTSTRSIIAGISAGARAYLSKPVDLEALDRKLRSAIGRKPDSTF
jgi:CheY-like chemotaxis protein